MTEYFKDPTKSINQISKITGISQATLKNYYDAFKEESFIEPDRFMRDEELGLRIFGDAHACPDFSKLKLFRLAIFFSGISDELSSEFESIIDELPLKYRIYHILIPQKSVVIEFVLPQRLVQKYIRLFQIFYNFSFYKKLLILKPLDYCRSPINFQKVSTEDHGDYSELEEVFSRHYLNKKENNIKRSNDDDVKLDLTDVKLLRELEINANLKLTTIAEFYDRDISTLSRRIKHLKKSYLKDYVIEFDFDSLSLVNYILIGKGTERVIDTIRRMMNHNIFWFESRFCSSSSEFIWSIHLYEEDFHRFNNFISNIVSIEHIFIVSETEIFPGINSSYYNEEDLWELKTSTLDNIQAKHVLKYFEKLSTAGRKINELIDKQEIDIYTVLEEKFLDFIDFVETLKNDPSALFQNQQPPFLRYTSPADKFMYAAILRIFSRGLDPEIVKYLEFVLLNQDYQN